VNWEEYSKVIQEIKTRRSLFGFLLPHSSTDGVTFNALFRRKTAGCNVLVSKSENAEFSVSPPKTVWECSSTILVFNLGAGYGAGQSEKLGTQ
jgi:hypothetical protein